MLGARLLLGDATSLLPQSSLLCIPCAISQSLLAVPPHTSFLLRMARAATPKHPSIVLTETLLGKECHRERIYSVRDQAGRKESWERVGWVREKGNPGPELDPGWQCTEVARATVRQAPCFPAPSPKDSWLVVTFLLIPSGPVRCGVQVCLFVPWLPSLIREVW